MSLITCCPACRTMFKVVPDQLRISEGWVRCGHCAEVFDASAHLLDADAAEPVPPMSDTQPAAITTAPVGPLPPAVAPAAMADEPMYPPFVLRAEEPAEPDEPDLPPEPLPSQAPRDNRPQPPSAVADVSFVRQARRRAYWRRPAVRAVLFLFALALGVLLAAQHAVRDRDRLAATQPALRPLIEALCQPLQCRVGPPRQIESIVIDSSTFNKLRGDAYRLSFAIKNQAANEVAMPAIELTLTDTQDQPVVRRVLTPVELGATSAQIAAQSDWSATLALSVTANGSAGRIAGYRLLAFYP